MYSGLSYKYLFFNKQDPAVKFFFQSVMVFPETFLDLWREFFLYSSLTLIRPGVHICPQQIEIAISIWVPMKVHILQPVMETNLVVKGAKLIIFSLCIVFRKVVSFIWLIFTRTSSPLEICRRFPQIMFILATRVRPINVGFSTRFFCLSEKRFLSIIIKNFFEEDKFQGEFFTAQNCIF